MTVYRGMDIGTAKPTQAERDEVPLPPARPRRARARSSRVAQFQTCARARRPTSLARSAARRSTSGGTGLYGRAVLDDFEIPGQFPEVRARARGAGGERARRRCYEELRALDPLAASRMEPTNARRIVRALEVTLGTRPALLLLRRGPRAYGPVRVVQVGLRVDADELDERIERAFRTWMDEGLLDEVTRARRSAPGD